MVSFLLVSSTAQKNCCHQTGFLDVKCTKKCSYGRGTVLGSFERSTRPLMDWGKRIAAGKGNSKEWNEGMSKKGGERSGKALDFATFYTEAPPICCYAPIDYAQHSLERGHYVSTFVLQLSCCLCRADISWPFGGAALAIGQQIGQNRAVFALSVWTSPFPC